MSDPITENKFVPPVDWLEPSDSSPVPLGFRFLLLTTILAAALRFYRLGQPSLWVDEILTWNTIRPDAGLVFWSQIKDAIQAPLYLVTVWPLARLQGNEFMLRLPSAVAGVLTVPLFGLLAASLVDNRAARLATLLLAISPFHIWYSQEARGYSFLIFFVVLLAWAYLEMATRDPHPGSALIFALAGAAAVLSNMSGLFLLLAMGLSMLMFHRPESRSGWVYWGIALGGAGLLAAPWILKASGIWAVDRILPGADTGVALRGQTTFSPLAIPYSLFTFFFGYSLGPSLRELHQPDRLLVLRAHWPLLALGVIPVGAGLVSALFRAGRKRFFLLVLVIVPMLVLVVLALRNIKPWNPRYLAVVFPFLLLLLALGLARLPGSGSRVLTLLLVLLCFWSLVGYFGRGAYAKADVRSAVRFIEDRNPQGEPVLVPVVTGVYDFYAQGQATLLDTYQVPPLANEEQALAFFKDRLASRPRFWFVASRQWFFDPHGLLPEVLKKFGRLRLEKRYPGVIIYHWVQRDPAGAVHG